jgi:hypothetical protein
MYRWTIRILMSDTVPTGAAPENSCFGALNGSKPGHGKVPDPDRRSERTAAPSRDIGPTKIPSSRFRFMVCNVPRWHMCTLNEVTGSAIYVYGAPHGAWYQSRAHQLFCLDSDCREIDVTHAYLNPPRISPSLNAITPDPGKDEVSFMVSNDSVLANNWRDPEFEPVLLYSMDGLDDQITHTMELRLPPSSDPYYAVMTLSQIVYTEVTYEYDHPRLPTPPPGVHPPPPPAFPEHAVRWTSPLPLPPPAPAPAPSPPLFSFCMLDIMKVTGMVWCCISCIRWFMSSFTGVKDENLRDDDVPNYSAIPRQPLRAPPPPPYTRFPPDC